MDYLKTLFLIVILLTSFIFNSSKLYAQLGNSNMYLLSNLDQYGSGYSACWGYRAPNGREYAILGCYSGTSFVDITDTANIHEVDFLPLPSGISSSDGGNGWREMKVFSNYAYIVSEAPLSGAGSSGVQIADLQYLPDSIRYVGKYLAPAHTRTHSISQSGPYLYLNGANTGFVMNSGIAVLDLTSNPQVPVLRGKWQSQYVHDCRVLNDTIWACNIYNPPGTISIINATNKNNLQTITSWVNNPNPFPHNCAITTDRRYILTTDETSTPNGKLKVWNIQNIFNVQFVTNWMPTGITTSIVHNVEIYGNYAVVAHYTAGVRVVNITNPASPQEAGWYDTYPSSNGNTYNGCWGVFTFPSGKIIGSDRTFGLFVLKTTFNITSSQGNNENIPKDFSLKQNYPNPFNPSTTIEYSLPKNGHVSIKVYDILGRQAATLVDEYKTAGDHHIKYDAVNLSSGVYFYKLDAEGFSQTKKMNLIK
ncbi:MAG: choice-of-anchor B family protein [Ignavibacteria bacterium]